jgi:hypothetical protein
MALRWNAAAMRLAIRAAFVTPARQPLPGTVHDLTAVRIWGIVW